MVRFVAGLAVETVIERTNAHKLLERVRDLLPGGDDSGTRRPGSSTPTTSSRCCGSARSTCSPGWPVGSSAGIDSGMNPGEVFSRVQDHVIHAARAHVERLVLEAFVEKVRAWPRGDNRVVLGLLCDLHALSSIEADRAWFMEHGRLTIVRSKEISRGSGRCADGSGRSRATWSTRSACPRRCCAAKDLIG